MWYLIGYSSSLWCQWWHIDTTWDDLALISWCCSVSNLTIVAHQSWIIVRENKFYFINISNINNFIISTELLVIINCTGIYQLKSKIFNLTYNFLGRIFIWLEKKKTLEAKVVILKQREIFLSYSFFNCKILVLFFFYLWKGLVLYYDILPKVSF